MLSPGDPMPFCYGMDGNRQFYSFEEQAGRPAVMVLARGLEGGELEQLAASFAHAEEEFARCGADVLVIGDEDVARRWVDNRSRVVDCGSPFLTRCGVLPGRYRVIVVDRSVRVAGVVPDGANGPVGACLGVLEAVPSEPAREVLLPAPVLMVPNLLSREVCGALIEAFETSVSCEGAVASMGLDGVAEARVDMERSAGAICRCCPVIRCLRRCGESCWGVVLPRSRRRFKRGWRIRIAFWLRGTTRLAGTFAGIATMGRRTWRSGGLRCR